MWYPLVWHSQTMRQRITDRNGITTRATAIQTDSLDQRTRVGIWNVIYGILVSTRTPYIYPFDDQAGSAARAIWSEELEQPLDEFVSADDVWSAMKGTVMGGAPGYVFNLIEALVEIFDQYVRNGERFSIRINEIFEQHLVGYRLVHGQVIRIDSAIEVKALEDGLSAAQPYSGAYHHLDRALALYADRDEPDFANSIKESLSAVEAIARELTGSQTLGKALDALTTKGITVDPGQIAAWKAMYGWSSNESGVRHGGRLRRVWLPYPQSTRW